MKDYQSLWHTKWDCKYHVVFIPKYRRKRSFGTGLLRLDGGAGGRSRPRIHSAPGAGGATVGAAEHAVGA